MNPELQSILTLLASVVAIAISYLNWRNASRKTEPEINNINADVITKQGQEIKELRDENVKLWDRFENVEVEMRDLRQKLRNANNALARAIKFINQHISNDITIPDFTITQDLKPLSEQMEQIGKKK